MEDNYLGVAENVDLLGGMMHDFHTIFYIRIAWNSEAPCD